jgi:hypothetical protein
MEAQVSGTPPTVEDRLLMAERFGFILTEALLRVCRELDERRAES